MGRSHRAVKGAPLPSTARTLKDRHRLDRGLGSLVERIGFLQSGTSEIEEMQMAGLTQLGVLITALLLSSIVTASPGGTGKAGTASKVIVLECKTKWKPPAPPTESHITLEIDLVQQTVIDSSIKFDLRILKTKYWWEGPVRAPLLRGGQYMVSASVDRHSLEYSSLVWSEGGTVVHVSGMCRKSEPRKPQI